MGLVTIIWSLCAGVSITLAAVCMFLWLMDRRDPASLMLCIQGVAVAASAYVELRMMRSATVTEYGELLRWLQIPTFLGIVGQVLFVNYFLRTGRLWLITTIIAARLIVLIVDLSVVPNF